MAPGIESAMKKEKKKMKLNQKQRFLTNFLSRQLAFWDLCIYGFEKWPRFEFIQLLEHDYHQSFLSYDREK